MGILEPIHISSPSSSDPARSPNTRYSSTMMLSIRYRHISPPASLDEKIEELLLPLGEHCRVDQAEVLIEHRAEKSPPYIAKVRVAVPGPDVDVQISDHTPENAYRRAVTEIDRRLQRRLLSRTRQRIRGRKHAQNFRIGRRSR